MSTILAFHAHPDDEAILTGGTLARLASEGHRTIVVAACDGNMNETTVPGARRRLDELDVSAATLGVARVVHLGYADSGNGLLLYPDPTDRPRFARADVEEAASRLAAIVREENVDLLLSYDARNHGDRDHMKVHVVGARAAEMTGVRVLEATFPREMVVRLFGTLRRLRLIRRYDAPSEWEYYTPRAAITHRISVRGFGPQKRAALAAHHSPVSGTGRGAPLLRVLLRVPGPVYGLLLGREWFAEPGATPSRGFISDIFRRA